MNLDQANFLFNFLSFSPGPFWLILIFFSQKKWAMYAFDGFLVFLSFIFSVLTFPEIPDLAPIIASPSFASINQFLSSNIGTLGAWNHMILSDLWIGRWMIYDAINHKVPIFVRLPCLFVIIFFGPLGLFMYLAYRIIYLNRFSLVEYR